MGAYVNPSNISFRKALRMPLYVDKSEMICDLNNYFDTENQYLCVSRARRFGKTMMANLISAYYSKGCDSRSLFEGLKLAQHPNWDRYLNSACVIKIDVNGWFRSTQDKNLTVKAIQSAVISELRTEFPSVQLPEEVGLANALVTINVALDETFVIIIDEYDVLFRENVSDSLRTEYLDLLNSLFKNDSLKPVISLAYITGILPIIRDRVQSKLNNFRQFTMLKPSVFAPYLGFLESEVRQLCEKRSMDFDRCAAMYDGYVFSGVGHVFNPNSVILSLENRDYDSYWVSTSSYDAITYYIDENIEGIQSDIRLLLEGGEVIVDPNRYLNNVELFNSKDQLFTYLTHLGYLTINPDENPPRCRIPNGEIRSEWFNALEEAKGFKSIKDLLAPTRAVLEATEQLDAPRVAAALDNFHAQYSSSLTFNRESSLQSAILMAYFYARKDFMVFAELPTGLGFADVALIPLRRGRAAIIIELKCDVEGQSSTSSPQKAIDQIKSRNYAQALAQHPGKDKGVTLVGITYDVKKKKHQCLIEHLADCSVLCH